jgi:2-methylfumaryl-CoA isomerase
MYQLLKGMRVIEGASFIAAPSCGLNLLQLGAEVIRFDNIGGGFDWKRWPVSPQGDSFYWEGLNKGKKSVAIDLSSPEGRELAVNLATAPGDNAGLFVTNFPVKSFLSHAALAAKRADIITVRVMGWGDGTSAVDYTVNCAFGIPAMTGHPSSDGGGERPVNHVLPAWDLIAGATATYSLLAAERLRRETGAGQEIQVPLGELGLATLGNIGQIAEVTAAKADRPKIGNDLYGAFGRDFATADGRRVMIVAITGSQWTAIVKTLGIGEGTAKIEAELGANFTRDEGLRFRHRARLFALVEPAVAKLRFAEACEKLDAGGVCWGPYRTMTQVMAEEPRMSAANPLFTEVEHPSGYRYLTPGAAMNFPGQQRGPARAAPRLGQHTDEVLAGVLGLSGSEIGELHDRRVIANAG